MGFGVNSGLNEIALLRLGRLGHNVKLYARDGPTGREWFHDDHAGGNNAMRRKSSADKFIGERHRETCRMGGGDQFIGVGSLSFPIAGPEVLTLRKGTAPGGYHAFSALEIADPRGRGVWFHGDRFQDEKGLDKPENKSPASRSNSGALLTRALPPRRTAVGGHIIRLQSSRFSQNCANTLFLGSA